MRHHFPPLAEFSILYETSLSRHWLKLLSFMRHLFPAIGLKFPSFMRQRFPAIGWNFPSFMRQRFPAIGWNFSNLWDIVYSPLAEIFHHLWDSAFLPLAEISVIYETSLTRRHWLKFPSFMRQHFPAIGWIFCHLRQRFPAIGWNFRHLWDSTFPPLAEFSVIWDSGFLPLTEIFCHLRQRFPAIDWNFCHLWDIISGCICKITQSSTAYKSELPNVTNWNGNPASGIGPCKLWICWLKRSIPFMFDHHYESDLDVFFHRKTQLS